MAAGAPSFVKVNRRRLARYSRLATTPAIAVGSSPIRTDDAVRLQGRDRHFGIAEVDGDHRHSRGARGAMSVPESPTMTAPSSRRRRAAMVRRSISGSGFCTPNVSWPQIAAKRGVRSERSSRRTRQPFQLVGADREPVALGRQPVERRLEPRERPRAVGDVVGIVRDEIGEEPVHFRRAGVRARLRREARSIMPRAPPPISRRAAANGTAGRPSRARSG